MHALTKLVIRHLSFEAKWPMEEILKNLDKQEAREHKLLVCIFGPSCIFSSLSHLLSKNFSTNSSQRVSFCFILFCQAVSKEDAKGRSVMQEYYEVTTA